MASPTYALFRIRRNVFKNGSRPPDPPTLTFDEYRDDYQEILEEIHILGGDLAIDDLTEWIISETKSSGTLPKPDVVRDEARQICEERDIIMPNETPLRL